MVVCEVCANCRDSGGGGFGGHLRVFWHLGRVSQEVSFFCVGVGILE